LPWTTRRPAAGLAANDAVAFFGIEKFQTRFSAVRLDRIPFVRVRPPFDLSVDLSEATGMRPLLEAVRPTTVIRSAKLCDHVGLDITIISETFQHTGSFKFRAAYNVASTVPNDEIIAVSSGNFGQAIAYACKLLGKRCTVVMPHNSAKVKVDAVADFGANVDLINVTEISRTERTEQLAAERPDAYIASAFDDQLVVDGNATLADEVAELGLDVVVIPIGGGGLISGFVQSFDTNGCSTRILGAEPLLANDAAKSLAAGRIIPNAAEPQTIADGTRTLSVGNVNFPFIQRGVERIIEVTEDRIKEAVRDYFVLANLKCEPTGALSLGAVTQEPTMFVGKTVGVVVSGGNVDPAVYAGIITG
jgi:threonine dehydratase